MTTAVFDLGGVVVQWDPVPAIAAVVGQERAEHFVHGSEFDFAAWNDAQDSGRSFAPAEAAATASHPELAEEIAAYRPNFARSLRGGGPGNGGDPTAPSRTRGAAGRPDELVSRDDPPRA